LKATLGLCDFTVMLPAYKKCGNEHYKMCLVSKRKTFVWLTLWFIEVRNNELSTTRSANSQWSLQTLNIQIFSLTV